MSDPCTCSWGAPHGDPCQKDEEELVEEYTPLMREMAYQAGAAVLGGLMGMAEAIKRRQGYQWVRFTTQQAQPIALEDWHLEDDERAS